MEDRLAKIQQGLSLAFNDLADKAGWRGAQRDFEARQFWLGAAYMAELLDQSGLAQEVAKSAMEPAYFRKGGIDTTGRVSIVRLPQVWDEVNIS